ncbi:hypothetical protein SCAR479_08948 [Seiridium cardinale]|uniref:Uncharacterized protein n=1 Tax=Seiridium cardinale TaxID=138064 RepID=A0ABR2XKN1_9PEZI
MMRFIDSSTEAVRERARRKILGIRATPQSKARLINSDDEKLDNEKLDNEKLDDEKGFRSDTVAELPMPDDTTDESIVQVNEFLRWVFRRRGIKPPTSRDTINNSLMVAWTGADLHAAHTDVLYRVFYFEMNLSVSTAWVLARDVTSRCLVHPTEFVNASDRDKAEQESFAHPVIVLFAALAVYVRQSSAI